MSWQGIEGHDAVVEQFRRALERGRLASTFLFVGPSGIGKRTFAEKLAQTLLCQTSPSEAMDPCGHCPGCLQVLSRNHPDLTIIAKPDDKSDIPLALLIGEDNRRMREGVCHDLALKPFMGGRKLAIIDDADYLNDEGANCLLKTLEEPPPDAVLILIGTSADQQLPTIRSRSQIVRFQPLSADELTRVLTLSGLIADPERAASVARFAEGSAARAMALADDALWTYREKLLTTLAHAPLNSVALAQDVAAFVESAGKEASVRRARARHVIGFAVEFQRQLLRAQCGVEPTGDAVLQNAVTQAARRPKGSVERTLSLIERSLAALEHVDRNAHQRTLVEAWIDEIGSRTA